MSKEKGSIPLEEKKKNIVDILIKINWEVDLMCHTTDQKQHFIFLLDNELSGSTVSGTYRYKLHKVKGQNVVKNG